jgi:hypothetical protein
MRSSGVGVITVSVGTAVAACSSVVIEDVVVGGGVDVAQLVAIAPRTARIVIEIKRFD